MTRIPPLTQALQWLRTERAQLRPAPGPAPAQPPLQVPTAAVQRTALGRLPGQLRALRASQGPVPRAKALRLFIHAALVDELGDHLLLDPAFADLVERTCAALEADAGNAALLDEAVEELTALSA